MVEVVVDDMVLRGGKSRMRAEWAVEVSLEARLAILKTLVHKLYAQSNKASQGDWSISKKA